MSNVIIKVYQSKNRIKSTEQLNQTNQMTYIKRFRLASSTCRFISFMKSVESLALVILWCLCTIPCIKNKHVELTFPNHEVFLTSGGVRLGVSYGETKTCPGPCFVNIDVEDFGGWNFDVLGGLPGFAEVGNLKLF